MRFCKESCKIEINYKEERKAFAMLDYNGIKCPVCDIPFRSEDDIVVCPECGAPYHRECFQKEGKCVFDQLHEKGEEWQPPAPPKAPDPTAEIKDKECPNCGTLNGHSALFCNRCGGSLLGEPQKYNNTIPTGTPPAYTTHSAPPPTGAFGSTIPPFAYDPMGGVSPAEFLDKNVTFGDASKLVKQNTSYYMPVFRYMKQTGRNKFNFSAFLFSGPWMLYRKQYKYGAIVTALIFCIYLAYLFCSVFISSPILLDLMETVNMDISQGFSPTSEQMLALTAILSENPLLYFQISLPLICLTLILIIMIVVGIRGNKMYMKHCIGMVRKVKSANVANDPTMTLDIKGGVNVSIAICMFVCYFVLVNIVPLLI